MRLLNLWPDASRNRNSLARRLWQESIIAFLVVVFVLTLVYVFLNWRLQQAHQVNQALQAHLTQAQAAATSIDESSHYAVLRSKNVGQLNWLALLPQLTDEHIQLTQVVQKKEGLQISGRADKSIDAQRLVVQVNQVLAESETVIESLQSKVDGWYFVVRTTTKKSLVDK